LPETERASNETILLPMFVGLTEAEQQQVAASLKEALTAVEPTGRLVAV